MTESPEERNIVREAAGADGQGEKPRPGRYCAETAIQVNLG
jgi:hypothetical protein